MAGWSRTWTSSSSVRHPTGSTFADGLLFGERTYEAFARDWPQITDPDDPFAERMNSLPKYVVSSTLATGDWEPTTVLRGDPTDTVAALKERPGRELQIHGSARLAHRLLSAGSAGLVDAVRLAVAPTIIGAGRRLLVHPMHGTGLRLVERNATSTGVLLVEYETAGPAPVAEYEGVTGPRDRRCVGTARPGTVNTTRHG
ncbi:MAG: deaminase [Propionibacteriales bacterium]|nr:deaminase [Propionibacteriales bacterium]